MTSKCCNSPIVLSSQTGSVCSKCWEPVDLSKPLDLKEINEAKSPRAKKALLKAAELANRDQKELVESANMVQKNVGVGLILTKEECLCTTPEWPECKSCKKKEDELYEDIKKMEEPEEDSGFNCPRHWGCDCPKPPITKSVGSPIACRGCGLPTILKKCTNPTCPQPQTESEYAAGQRVDDQRDGSVKCATLHPNKCCGECFDWNDDIAFCNLPLSCLCHRSFDYKEGFNKSLEIMGEKLKEYINDLKF